MTKSTMKKAFEKNQLVSSDSESESDDSDIDSGNENDDIEESSSPASSSKSAEEAVIENVSSNESNHSVTIEESEESLSDIKNLSLNDEDKENVKDNSNIIKQVSFNLERRNSHDEEKERSLKDDSFKNFLGSKKNEHVTSSPYETANKKSGSKIIDESRISIDESRISESGSVIKSTINDSEQIIVSDSSASGSSDLEIIDDSYNQMQVSNSKGSNNQKDDLVCIIESSESENSDVTDNASVSSDNSLKSLPSASNASIKCIGSNKSLSTSNLSNGSFGSIKSNLSNISQNSSIKSTTGLSEKSILEGQVRNKAVAYQNLVKALRSCDTRKLKDGGKLLEENMMKCKIELDELKQKLRTLTGGGDPDIIEVPTINRSNNQANPLLSTKDQVTANLGKKGLETYRVQSALTVNALVTLHDSLKTCPTPETFETDPQGLKVDLMPHQKHALAWLLWRENQLPRGGILADDMGLGKTLTMIALVLKADEYKEDQEDDRRIEEAPHGGKMYPGNTLVVCPASLVGQWESQIKQHCKKNLLNVLVHHGQPREVQANRLAKFDIVITTYGVITEEFKTIPEKNRKGALFRVNWERIILDEAHVIRNHKTKKAEALCEIEGKYRWCLTGTPVHNKEMDMYSLLKFLKCSPFDDLVVWKRWIENKSAHGLQRLNTVVKSILLRRTKEDLKGLGELKDLPTKDLKSVYVELTEEEMKVYMEVLQFSKNLFCQYLVQKEEKAGMYDERIAHIQNSVKQMGNIQTSEILVLLLRLRQLCCLPGLIHSMLEKDTCAEDGIEPEAVAMENLVSQVRRLSVGPSMSKRQEEEEEKAVKLLVDSNPVFDMKRPSRKVQTVLEIIEEILETDDKVVIVSQWTSLLRTLEMHIRRLKVGIVTLDGSVPVKARTKIVDDFNDKKTNVRIILLSLNAGGVGLNLIGGNRLIIFEPHWNPQLEAQACDRIYRVGQKKPVQVYKIICKDTIEERIEALQKKKTELADNVLKGELKKQGSKLSLQDLMTLFDLGASQPQKV